MRLSGLPRSSDMPRNEFRVLSKISLSPFSRRGRLSRGWCTVHCCCAVVVKMFELSKSIAVSCLAWNLVLVILSPSPLSVSLDIVVSIGSWFATPLGVDLVSANLFSNLFSSFVRGSVVDRKECVSACHATLRVVSGTCILRYLMNDLLFHLAIIWIVSTFSPARYMAMAAPDLFECVPMSSALNPSRRSPIVLVAVHSCSSTAVEDRYFNSSSAVPAHALIPGLAICGCRP
jgi:hypothetical protein